jgi:hypothetical protein
MNAVTQQSAASALESASSSEQMSAQVRIMKELVAELVSMVGLEKNGKKQFKAAGSVLKSVPYPLETVRKMAGEPFFKWLRGLFFFPFHDIDWSGAQNFYPAARPLFVPRLDSTF